MPFKCEEVVVEIVAKRKGCMLCDLAICILEEISMELPRGTLRWEVVDMGDRQGLLRHQELTALCGRKPAVPSIVINDKIAFDHIPDPGSLRDALREAMNLADW